MFTMFTSWTDETPVFCPDFWNAPAFIMAAHT